MASHPLYKSPDKKQNNADNEQIAWFKIVQQIFKQLVEGKNIIFFLTVLTFNRQ
jgi:hypothetical protein